MHRCLKGDDLPNATVQTREQIQALSALQANCEIRSITLVSCSASNAKAASGRFKEPYSVKPILSNVAPVCQDGFLIVSVSFEYSAWDASEPPERLFLVNCTFELIYELHDNYSPSNDQIVSFGRGTAVFNCWPYAREFLQSITSRLGHQTPAIPLLRIVPKKADPKAKLMEATTAELPAGEGADG
jgi:hypothetical protein